MSLSREDIEKEVQEKKLNAPRITQEHIDSVIVDEDYVIHNEKIVTCILYLKNGYMVTGESAIVSRENFDFDLGKKISRSRAVDKVWQLESYLLQQRLYENSIQSSDD